MQTRALKNKYRNIKTEKDGYIFDSKAEAKRYQELKLLKQAGEIKGFTIQPSFVLEKGIRYKADFMVCDNNNKFWVEDVKGIETQAFKIKKRLWNNNFSWLELRIIK